MKLFVGLIKMEETELFDGAAAGFGVLATEEQEFADTSTTQMAVLAVFIFFFFSLIRIFFFN